MREPRVLLRFLFFLTSATVMACEGTSVRSNPGGPLADAVVDDALQLQDGGTLDSRLDTSDTILQDVFDGPLDSLNMVYSIPGQSCPPSMPSCLAGGSVSCCQSILMDGGTYAMGRSLDGGDRCPDGSSACSYQELPEHWAMVQPFKLDTFEVTVGRFREFVKAYDGTKPKTGQGAHPLRLSSGWDQVKFDDQMPSTRSGLTSCNGTTKQTWVESPTASSENKPINCVNWYVAFAFCIWDGGRLPSEAEWEFAAAGGIENRLYPWGSKDPSTDSTLTVFNGANIASVGSLVNGKSLFGHFDLGGNIGEWMLDYSGDYTTAVCNNCVLPDKTNVGQTPMKVFRGGGYTASVIGVRAAFRWSQGINERNDFTGFRCARDL